MIVLVTGATGFIGGALVRALLADGEEVRAFVRAPADPRARALADAGATIVRGDISDRGALCAAADGCAVVYNLAVSPRFGSADALSVVNVAGARNAALAATAARARLVHGSTGGVYGVLRAPAAEDHPTRPERPYPISKLAGERAIAQVASGSDLSVAIARIGSVYGPGNLRGVGGFRSVMRPLTPVVAGARHLIDLVYVDDLVDGLRACGARRDPGTSTYNLAGGAPQALRTVLAEIAGCAGRPLRAMSLPRAPFAILDAVNRRLLLPRGIDSRLQHRFMEVPRSRALSIDRAAADLGYRPTVGLHEGVARTLDWYHETGLIGPGREGGRT